MKKAVRHAIRHSRAAFAWGRYNNLHKKYSSKGTAPKVSKGRRLASGESAEGGSRKRSDNDRKALWSPPQRRNLFAAYQDMI